MREERVSVVVSEFERELIREAAGRRGLTTSAFARRVLVEASRAVFRAERLQQAPAASISPAARTLDDNNSLPEPVRER